MQNLRKLNIFQIYVKLPFLIQKQTYLIPQRPFPKTLTDPQPSDIDLSPSKPSKFTIDTSVDKIVQSLIHNESSSKKKQPSQYETLLSDYISFYILPLYKANRITVAINLYARENINNSTALSEGKDRIGKQQISQRFSALPIEDRWPYLLRAESIIAERRIQFSAYHELFGIPKPKAIRSLDLYLNQRKADKQRKKYDDKPSAQQEKRLAQLRMKFQNQYKHALTTFLQEYKLTIPQFNIIKEVCEKASNRLLLQKKYLNGQKQYQRLMKNGEIYYAKILRKDNKKLAKDIQKLSTFMANLSQEQLKAYQELISIPSSPHFKRQQFQQLYKQQLQHQKAIQAETAKEKNTQKIVEQTISIQNILKSIEKTTQLPERPNHKEENQAQIHLQSSSKAQSALLQQTQPIRMGQQQAAEVALNEDDPSADQNQQEAQLKDENLNDMEIIEDDYEVLRLNRLIEKARKPKIPVKKYVY